MTSSNLAKAAASAASSAANPLGSAPGYKWLVDDNNVNMAMALPPPRVVTIDAQPQTVTIDLNRTVLIVVDMQNDFCAKADGSTISASITPRIGRRSSRCKSCSRC